MTGPRGDDALLHSAMDSALADLSRRAIEVSDASEMFAIAVDCVIDALHVDLSSVIEYRPLKGDFAVRVSAGSVLRPMPPPLLIPDRGRGFIAQALEANEPLIVDDWLTESRYEAPLLAQLGIRSSIAMVIDGEKHPFGILSANTVEQRSFTPAEVLFIRSIASILAAVIRRARDEERYRTMIETTLDAVWMVDGEERTTFVNQRMLEMFGYTKEELMQSTRAQMLEDPYDPANIAAIERRRRGIAEQREVRLRRKDGTCFWALAATTPLRSSDGEYAGWLAMLLDIDDRKKAEELLRQSEEKLRGVLDRARDAIYTLTTDGMIESVNPAATEITGWSTAELTSMRFTDIVHPDDKPMAQAYIDRILKGERTNFAILRVRCANGSYAILETTAGPAIENGRITGVFGIGRDITGRERDAAEREHLRSRIELLLESTYDGIVAVDLAGNCTLVNAAASRILGRSAEELIGQNMHELAHARGPSISPQACRIEGVAITRKPAHFDDEYFVRADGTIFPVDVDAAPMIENGAIVGTVISFTDATERRALQSELDRANRLTMLGRLAATMAHEFNNVLMGIQPFAEIIDRRAPDDTVRKPAKQILQSVKRGRAVTHEILRFTRPVEPTKFRLDLRDWLAELMPELSTIVPPQVSVSTQVKGDQLIIDADGAQLAQVVTNFVANARDAMAQGGSVTITARRGKIGERFHFGIVPNLHLFAHLSIADTGEGIPPEALDRIFEPFFTTKKKGTGLGLAVAHQIVEAHGGRIFVESVVGEGTTFHLFLPLSEEAARMQPAASGEERRLPGRVLVVEDEEDVASGLAELLRDWGIMPSIATTGAEALEAIDRELPDAIVLDVKLPDMSGIDVYDQVARRFPTLPVIFSSAHADAKQLERILSQPHVAFLLKPYESRFLLDALRETSGR